MLTRHQSSLKTNQISIGPYLLEIKEEKIQSNRVSIDENRESGLYPKEPII